MSAEMTNIRRARVDSPSSAAELLVAAGLLVLGFGARLTATLKGSGLDGIMYYDEGVNFAAALGLVHGSAALPRLPVLHPPGIVLALAPFAALASVTGDASGFVWPVCAS